MMDAASKGNYLVLFQKNKSQIIKNISFAILMDARKMKKEETPHRTYWAFVNITFWMI